MTEPEPAAQAANPVLHSAPEAQESETTAAAAGQVEAARQAAREGNLAQARQMLRAAVADDPQCVEGWLGLAWLARSGQERESLLRRVLALEPGHPQALAEVARLQQAAAVPPPERQHARRRRLLWLGGALLAILALLVAAFMVWGPVDRSLAWLLPAPTPSPSPTPTETPAEAAARFVPQLEAALAAGEWDRALEITTIMQALDPGDESVRRWSFQAHMQVGQYLVESGQADQALQHFVEARALAPEDPVAQRWETSTRAYVSGLRSSQAGQWDAAIASFTKVGEQMPDYPDAYPRLIEAYRRKAQAASAARDWSLAIETLIKVRELAPGDQGLADSLALAYRERGIAREEADKLKEARADLEAALVLWPHDAKAREHLDQVMLQLFPPKRIDINISKQRMLVYEGDTVIHEWRISTGLPGRDTAAGHFKVLDKIPMAYSSIWRLKMPYWLGIYYVGRIENGIHALPIRPDGTVMWGGLLGTKQSYGCVILDNKAAKTLFDWAEIGTRVDIHY